MRFILTIDIKQNNHFGSQDMVVLYWQLHCHEACYNEVELKLQFEVILPYYLLSCTGTDCACHVCCTG